MFYLIISMIFVVLITTFALVLSVCIKIDKIKKEVRDLSENQFDAEQVMKLYEMKFSRPIITQERADVQCLFQTVELPYELMRDIKEGSISEKEIIENELVYKFSKMILPYIEYRFDYDDVSRKKVAKGRLRVLKKNIKNEWF